MPPKPAQALENHPPIDLFVPPEGPPPEGGDERLHARGIAPAPEDPDVLRRSWRCPTCDGIIPRGTNVTRLVWVRGLKSWVHQQSGGKCLPLTPPSAVGPLSFKESGTKEREQREQQSIVPVLVRTPYTVRARAFDRPTVKSTSATERHIHIELANGARISWPIEPRLGFRERDALIPQVLAAFGLTLPPSEETGP
jgi:hypothetical protein